MHPCIRFKCQFQTIICPPRNRLTNLVWTKDGLAISPSGEDRIDYGMDGSLTLYGVQKRHEGKYR